MPLTTPQLAATDAVYIFPANKESAYGTVQPDGDLLYRITSLQQAVGQFAPTVETGVGRFGGPLAGKGFPVKGDFEQIALDYQKQISAPVSPQLMAHVAAFAMGAVSTSGAGDPYMHTITYDDPASGLFADSFTLHEESGADAYKALGCVITGFTLTIRPDELLQLQWQIVGSGERAAAIVSPPAVTNVDEIRAGDVTIALGAQGGSADITDQVQELVLQVNRPVPDALRRGIGGGLYAQRAISGRGSASAQLTVIPNNDTTFQDLVTNATVQELIMTATKSASREVKVTLPSLRFQAGPASEIEGVHTLQLSTGDGGVSFDSGATPAEPVQVEVKNEVAAYLTPSA